MEQIQPLLRIGIAKHLEERTEEIILHVVSDMVMAELLCAMHNHAFCLFLIQETKVSILRLRSSSFF